MIRIISDISTERHSVSFSCFLLVCLLLALPGQADAFIRLPEIQDSVPEENDSASLSSGSDTIVPAGFIRFPEEKLRDKIIDGTRIIIVNGKGSNTPQAPQDSVRALVNTFYLNQFRYFQDPQLPTFLFMTKAANLAMGIGGTIELRGWYDWNGSIEGSDFVPAMITIPKDPTKSNRLDANASESCIFLTVIGRNTPLGNYMAYVEGSFSGYRGRGFRLKRAYFTIRDFTAGFTRTTFSDPQAQPPVVDGAGANSKITKICMLVRYMHTWNNNLTLAASLEFPKSDITVQDNLTAACSDYLPDVAAFLQYSWDRGLSHVRLAGICRTMKYRDLTVGRNRNAIGWGFQLSSSWKIVRPLSFYTIAAYGRGISSFVGDMIGTGGKPRLG